jgi:uncharacterized 2Fe-2S/4Fe-4S cluster protein (DUF4445 family)
MKNTFLLEPFQITVLGRKTCVSHPNETILSALRKAEIAVSAPCGGRGMCGKCRVMLCEGEVLLKGSETELHSGDIFSACKGIPLSNITIELLEDENGFASELPRNTEDTPKNKIAQKKKIFRAGVGLDIGTTTIQAELINLDTGESLDVFSELNAERIFGADVINRIAAARNGNTAELFKAINHQTEDLLRYFIKKWNLSNIEHCVVSGNTTMLHLFANINPSDMGESPFSPVFLDEKHFSGAELNLSAEKITLTPGISAFIGGDIVSGIAFLHIIDQDTDALFVDIGTNGEMALWKHEEKRLICCSSAAGPCFEGAEISCGMGALSGAINRICLKEKMPKVEHVFHFGPLSFTTIGNAPPKGICGAALIDALSVMKQLAAIDETGALDDAYTENGFPIAEGIFITQKDIRQFQLAKSAIRSGIDMLCEKAGIKNPSNLSSVFIAGGLGFYIDAESAIEVGLFPPEFRGKIAACGNTSLKGAAKSLSDTSFLSNCKKIVACSESAELASDISFSAAFAENMYF